MMTTTSIYTIFNESTVCQNLRITYNKEYIFQVCRYQPEVQKMFDFSAERTLQSVDESLKRLGLDYIDVIQVKGNV